ncbi:protein WVD2-like 7 [Rhododendron vialii]|uniref:protein WVD2-like 7 n=1 Tax=Rhododendron vialii TaxID=182163 RepID=UPI00265D7977|nr:protein WVD2-like 7 [Rhododendron vialii]
MGESTAAAALDVENKVGESVASGAALEASVSFGRFERDSLSWEKWSSFSQNKYLEEVEKFSAPGSVAQKKAYFEAHYKKVASRKAEPQGQEEKQTEIKALTMNDLNGEEIHHRNTSGTDTEVDIVMCQSSAEEVEQVSDSNDVLDSSLLDESNDSATSTIECRNSLVDGAKEEFDSIPDGLELSKLEEAVVVQEGTCISGSQENVNLLPVVVQEETNLNGAQDMVQFRSVLEETRNNMEIEKDIANLDSSKISEKIIPTRKERDLEGTKKKPASPLPKKSPQISTPKLAKPTPSPTLMSASRSITKRESGLALPRSKNLSAGERKEIVPPPLQMSPSLSPANSESTPPTMTRKSLIMEKMGDKDIVKRAFKTFQNNFNQVQSFSSSYEMSSRETKVSTARPEQKFGTSLTSRKENEGVRRAAEKMDAQKGQLGRSLNSPLGRSLKGASMDQRIAKPAPSSIGSISDGRAEKQRELSNKLEKKSYAKEVEKTRLHSKPKEEKLRQSLNLKATPMPGSYRGHGISKNLLDKEGTQNLHHLRPEMQR